MTALNMTVMQRPGQQVAWKLTVDFKQNRCILIGDCGEQEGFHGQGQQEAGSESLGQRVP